MSNDALVQVSADFNDVHQISVALMNFLQDNDIPPELALPALMMSVGRLCSPRILKPEEDKAFVEALAEWQALYFMDGRAN